MVQVVGQMVLLLRFERGLKLNVLQWILNLLVGWKKYSIFLLWFQVGMLQQVWGIRFGVMLEMSVCSFFVSVLLLLGSLLMVFLMLVFFVVCSFLGDFFVCECCVCVFLVVVCIVLCFLLVKFFFFLVMMVFFFDVLLVWELYYEGVCLCVF